MCVLIHILRLAESYHQLKIVSQISFSSHIGLPNLPYLLSLQMLQRGFPGGTTGKEPVCQCRRRKRGGFDPWVGKIPWRRAWQSTPVFFLGKFHGQRSLVSYSSWRSKGIGEDLATKQQFSKERLIWQWDNNVKKQ